VQLVSRVVENDFAVGRTGNSPDIFVISPRVLPLFVVASVELTLRKGTAVEPKAEQ
jgi:hypothetical protein